jgi:hypothetical protein
MTSDELSEFAIDIDGGASKGSALLFQPLNICKALGFALKELEQAVERAFAPAQKPLETQPP